MNADSDLMPEILNPDVAAVFNSYPAEVREKLLFLCQLILETAAETAGVGELEETLKWGEPSYLTPVSKSGSTVRIAWKQGLPDHYAMYFKCTTNLVETFRERYPTKLIYGGNRSIVFAKDDTVPVSELKRCIGLALTYHKNKKLPRQERWNLVESSRG